jgi:hypothetical protein
MRQPDLRKQSNDNVVSLVSRFSKKREQGCSGRRYRQT